MHVNEGHPSDQTLIEWAQDALPTEVLTGLDDHIEHCPRCAERLGVLHPPDDPLLSAIRRGLQDTTVGAPADADANFRFGMSALESGYLEQQAFIACAREWMRSPERSFAEVALEQGSMSPEQVDTVWGQLTRGRRKTAADDTLQETTNKQNLPPPDRKDLEIVQLHSTGGVGKIWRAHDPLLGRDVALKELRPEYRGSRGVRGRFFREARITAQLTHPGTVPLYAYHDEDARVFYTMKLLHGETLSEAVTRFHSEEHDDQSYLAGLLELINAFVYLGNTIAYAHSEGVIHRDLKPQNVMLGDFGEVTLLDWGLAKHIDGREELVGEPFEHEPAADNPASLTITGQRLGTPAYMAPEQAKGLPEEADRLTDVYGLCGVLYHILTGKAPFIGADVDDVLRQVETEPPPKPSELVPRVPLELEEVCLKGLEKEKSRRHASAADVTEAVKRWQVDIAHQKQEQRTREYFFGLSKDLVAIIDYEGNILQANPAWEEILGWRVDEVVGKTSWDFITPATHEIASRNMHKLRAGEPSLLIEHRCPCKDGSIKVVLWSTVPAVDRGIAYAIGRDITELELTQNRLTTIIEATPWATVVAGGSGSIELVNRQTEKLFGYDRDEMLGQPLEMLIPERFHESHRKRFQEYFREPFAREMGEVLHLVGRHRDGREIAVDISLSPAESESGWFIVASLRKTGEVPQG